MSDYRAIGGVSASLQALLLDRMEVPPGLPSLVVSVGPPISEQPENSSPEPARLNLFLYQVSESAFLKNQEIPGQGHPAAYGRPPLPLVLNYLVTAFGTETVGEDALSETRAHMLLGSAMQTFHDFPVITDALLDRNSNPILHESLRGEFEKVKLHLDPISLEDLSKLWTALMQPFRISAAYSVSVVQIESRRKRHFPRPVGEPPGQGPRVIVFPMGTPEITALWVHRQGDAPGVEHPYPFASIGDTLILTGINLKSAGTRVRIGKLDASQGITSITRDRLAVDIPDNSDLQPGAQPVVVITAGPDPARSGVPSNQAVFMLVPLITGVAKDTAASPRRITISGNRVYSAGLSGEVLIGDFLVEREAYLEAAGNQIDIPIPDPLPAWPAPVLRSGDLSTFPAMASGTALDMTVEINGAGPFDTSLARLPADIEETARLLQAAIRKVRDHEGRIIPAFQGARVAADRGRLLVVPGRLKGAVTLGGGIADLLKLTTQATRLHSYLSGRLRPYRAPSAVTPKLRLTMNGATHDLTLAVTGSFAETVNSLESAIQGFGDSGFAGARVSHFDDQIMVIPGAASVSTVTFGAVPGDDESTVGELQLNAHYRVRVRVNGAENVVEKVVSLP